MTTNKLGKFENLDVVATSIAVTNAGDGLSKALGVDPEVFHLEDELTVALHCVVAKVRHEPTKDDPSSVIRVHVLRAGNAVIIDDDTVEKALREQAERIRLAEEEAEGVLHLEFEEEGE